MTPEALAAQLAPARLTPLLIRPLLVAATDAVYQAVRAETPVSATGHPGRRPGTLRDSWQQRLSSDTEGRVWTDDPVAGYVEYGTRPHTITARHTTAAGRPGMLAWTDARGPHFARTVQHPGTAPNPIAERAVEQATPQIEVAAEAAGTTFLAGIG